MQIAFIDHYDSFSFNLIDWVAKADSSVEIIYVPFDDSVKMDALRKHPLPLILSPGPKAPQDAQQTVNLVQSVWGRVPMLGICLGHQILAYAKGASINLHPDPHHGMRRSMRIMGVHPIFSGCPEMMNVGVYHSLTVDIQPMPEAIFDVIAIDQYDQVQAISVRDPLLPATIGLQFHPESFMSADGHRIAKNWLNLLRTKRQVLV